MGIRKLLLTFIIVVVANQLFAQIDIKEKNALTIGETITFQSKILHEDRLLNIYLPHGYSADSSNTYPVIYLLDGSIDEDFIHISGLVQFGSFSWINIIPESIVVGISNIDRKKDFTFPTTKKKDKKKFPTTGSSDNFISFLENELQPLIEKTYKTDTIKTLIGQSLGGLLATEVLFKKPELFDHYIIISPSLWWDNESLLAYEPSLYSSKKSIYVAVGKEGKTMGRTAQALYDKLNLKKKVNTSLYFDFFENQIHGDVLHLATYHAFEKIFKQKE